MTIGISRFSEHFPPDGYRCKYNFMSIRTSTHIQWLLAYRNHDITGILEAQHSQSAFRVVRTGCYWSSFVTDLFLPVQKWKTIGNQFQDFRTLRAQLARIGAGLLVAILYTKCPRKQILPKRTDRLISRSCLSVILFPTYFEKVGYIRDPKFSRASREVKSG